MIDISHVWLILQIIKPFLLSDPDWCSRGPTAQCSSLKVVSCAKLVSDSLENLAVGPAIKISEASIVSLLIIIPFDLTLQSADLARELCESG